MEWSKWVSWASYWYNTTWKVSTGYTPYEIVYGRPPPSLFQCVPRTARVQAVEDSLLERDYILKLLKDHFLKAQSRMKHFADKRRTERHFEVGDFVFLKLQPYKQSSVKESTSHNLAARFNRPY